MLPFFHPEVTFNLPNLVSLATAAMLRQSKDKIYDSCFNADLKIAISKGFKCKKNEDNTIDKSCKQRKISSDMVTRGCNSNAVRLLPSGSKSPDATVRSSVTFTDEKFLRTRNLTISSKRHEIDKHIDINLRVTY